MKTIWLARHLETDWNRQGRFLGRTDLPTASSARGSLAGCAARLSALRPQRVICSGLRRAAELARRVQPSSASWSQPVVDPRWREIDHGLWEGLTHGEVAARYPRAARHRYDYIVASRAHGGESVADLRTRVLAALESLSRRAEERLLVVTHAGPIRLLLTLARRRPLEELLDVSVQPGAVCELRCSGDDWDASLLDLDGLPLGALPGAAP